MANIGLPGTNSFIGEFLIIMGCFLVNSWAGFYCATGMVLGGAYSLWLLNRIVFGNIKSYAIIEYQDLTRFEFYYLFPFAFMTVLFGIYPEPIICYLYLI
jgi:NADH-quinone oxidoreductase subunit M